VPVVKNYFGRKGTAGNYFPLLPVLRNTETCLKKLLARQIGFAIAIQIAYRY